MMGCPRVLAAKSRSPFDRSLSSILQKPGEEQTFSYLKIPMHTIFVVIVSGILFADSSRGWIPYCSEMLGDRCDPNVWPEDVYQCCGGAWDGLVIGCDKTTLYGPSFSIGRCNCPCMELGQSSGLCPCGAVSIS